jgi:hypothetical protein
METEPHRPMHPLAHRRHRTPKSNLTARHQTRIERFFAKAMAKALTASLAESLLLHRAIEISNEPIRRTESPSQGS